MKRTRQRVDAGEPRNSYASIANFSSRGGYHGYNHKYGSSNSSNSNRPRTSCPADAIMEHQASLLQQLCQQGPMAAAFMANHAQTQPPATLATVSNKSAADQFNTGGGYNQFLTQLQSSMNPNNDNNMAMAATLFNNLQANEIAAAAAAAAATNNSLFNANNMAAAAAFDAQLLRDILESGAAAAAAAVASAENHNNVASVQSSEKMQLQQSISSKHSTTDDPNELNKSSNNGSISSGNKHRFNVDDLFFDYFGDPNILTDAAASVAGCQSNKDTTISSEHDPIATAAFGDEIDEKNPQRTDDDQLAKPGIDRSQEANHYTVYDDDPRKTCVRICYWKQCPTPTPRQPSIID
ncbi:hypothetical protein BLA29_001137 [Euroglyphus maynei]|uniref:Uncharacterized protein n=1 Tax=Euroglyphus maynei TaxID=6958 RepID=A0A1Y3BUH3_EURMA|nr:hypothetical protein BLA29_001137 [Euroglyphus maynei]